MVANAAGIVPECWAAAVLRRRVYARPPLLWVRSNRLHCVRTHKMTDGSTKRCTDTRTHGRTHARTHARTGARRGAKMRAGLRTVPTGVLPRHRPIAASPAPPHRSLSSGCAPLNPRKTRPRRAQTRQYCQSPSRSSSWCSTGLQTGRCETLSFGNNRFQLHYTDSCSSAPRFYIPNICLW